MKSILVGLVSVGTVALAGWQMAGWAPVSTDTSGPAPELATSSEEIAGTWFSLPNGLMLQFGDDGTAQFGVDNDGTTLGYDAQTWFEGTHLFVRFEDYDGASEACATDIGIYEVELLESGNLRFVHGQDDCEFRLESLQGTADSEIGLQYNPVD
jgi:hypothetical protein